MEPRNEPADEAEFDHGEGRAVLTEALDERLESEADDALDAAIEAEDGQIAHLLHEPETKAAVKRVVRSVMMETESHRGPLPSPRQLALYEDCLGGAAERIVAMAEREQAHRHHTVEGFGSFRNETLNHVKTRDARGQFLGAFVCCLVIGLCFFMVVKGSPGSAAGLAGATLVGLAGVFVTRQKANKAEQESTDD